MLPHGTRAIRLACQARVEAREHVMQVVRRRVAQRVGVLAEALLHAVADHERLDPVGVEEARLLAPERAGRKHAQRGEIARRRVARTAASRLAIPLGGAESESSLSTTTSPSGAPARQARIVASILRRFIAHLPASG